MYAGSPIINAGECNTESSRVLVYLATLAACADRERCSGRGRDAVVQSVRQNTISLIAHGRVSIIAKCRRWFTMAFICKTCKTFCRQRSQHNAIIDGKLCNILSLLPTTATEVMLFHFTTWGFQHNTEYRIIVILRYVKIPWTTWMWQQIIPIIF